MTDHVNQLYEINPDHAVLRNENSASQIAKAKINLATSLKNDGTALTGIVPRLDQLNNKANEVNLIYC